MNNPPGEPSTARPQSGREEALFEAALAMPEPERRDWLQRACGDDALLLRRVEKLLESNNAAGDFLEPTAPALAGGTVLLSAPVTEAPGDIIGRYKIREKLGEGGWGVVYVAEQTEPVRRRVALKIIKLGMDTRNVVARFEAERQALAMMDHPNIAKVLDAGATEAGRPFFVMELVRGIRITDYCDQNHLDTCERLKLFVQVCHAVQHAHQKGVIHRDIKPSNVLVTLHDGVPVPKVIDFGIAKATEGRLSHLTVYTELHQFMGTPAYMSPEQAEMSGLDIDTRTDIYSLGVLLYELLTGSTPFDAQELLRCGVDEMRRTIREKEPPRPSTRLSALAPADRAAMNQRRASELPRLAHLMRGDLDWIVMKGLEKDRTRRYETASELAMDVERFLRNEAVEARPPSSIYRLQKLVHRNRTVFAAVGAVAAALVLGLGLSLFLFVQERHALRRALAAEKQQAALREQAERGLAIERGLKAMASVTDKFTEAGRLLSRGEFEKAEAAMAEVQVRFPQSSIVWNAMGEGRARRGQWLEALTNYTRSVEADPTNHHAYDCLAVLLLKTGDRDGYHRCRRAILEQFSGTRDPNIAQRMAKACLLLPVSAADQPGILRITGACAVGPAGTNASASGALVQGLADYRAGRFDAAVASLGRVVAQEQEPPVAAQGSIVLAMSRHRLQPSADSRTTVANATAGAVKLELDRADWTEALMAQLLSQEAINQISNEPATAQP